ncbi:MAG TPA: carboxypeptidase regulatory-like domain-containing protein [Thermoanaerobaculia bacterium]
MALLGASANAQSINGTVREAQTGAPLRSMVVAAYTSAGALQANATTDANGRYDIALPAGRYRVLAYDPTGTFATQFAADAPSFEESPETVIVALQSVTINFALQRGGMVSGIVLTSGGARAGLIVAAYNLSGTRRGFTSTSSSGAYSLVLPPGNYKIAAYDDAGAFAPAFFRDRTNFAEADIVTVTAGRSTGADLFLQLGARVSGTVTNSSGAPVANAIVIAFSATGSFVTFTTADANGAFMLTIAPGTYRFVAVDNSFTYAAGFLGGASSFESSPPISLAAGQVRSDLSFRLERGGLVAGRVVDATTGAGIAGITVAAYNPDGTQRTFVTTDANGGYVLLLPSGNFKIAAFDSLLVYATQFYPQQISFAQAPWISIAVGQTTSLQPLMLSKGGHVSGTVSDQLTAAPVKGALVAAYAADGSLVATATTSEAGAYRLVLTPGAYRLVAFDPHLLYAPAYLNAATSFDASSPLTITVSTDAKADFALRRGTLVRGSVVDNSGLPAAGIAVTALDLNGDRVASATTVADGSFQLALVPGTYKFVAVDPAGRYRIEYYGGATFADAAKVTVDATDAPRVALTVHLASRRRAARH